MREIVSTWTIVKEVTDRCGHISQAVFSNRIEAIFQAVIRNNEFSDLFCCVVEAIRCSCLVNLLMW